VLYEAPNWTVDGHLVLNGDGVLWRLDAAGGSEPERIAITGVPELNNDHVLAPDGKTIYLSANDRHLYAAPLAGGAARRVTPDHGTRMHFLHGVSPDGTRLAYIGLVPEGDNLWAAADVYTIGVDGTDDQRLTNDPKPADGSEYSPDGAWIYFNTERFSTEPGHAQIARMRPDGTGVEQLTFDERVNWFPHLAPVGGAAVYLSFPPGTTGHPADRTVDLRIVRDADSPADWVAATVLRELPGGQGTINVNSWAPDGRRFAFVEYPR
jgi:Tol biopolymer transport system component